jgi:hypothetical protein
VIDAYFDAGCDEDAAKIALAAMQRFSEVMQNLSKVSAKALRSLPEFSATLGQRTEIDATTRAFAARARALSDAREKKEKAGLPLPPHLFSPGETAARAEISDANEKTLK